MPICLLEVVDYSDEHYMEHMEVTRADIKRTWCQMKFHASMYLINVILRKANGREDVPVELPHIGKDCIYMAAGQHIGLRGTCTAHIRAYL